MVSNYCCFCGAPYETCKQSEEACTGFDSGNYIIEEHRNSGTYSLLKKNPTESLSRKLDAVLKKAVERRQDQQEVLW